MSIRTRLIISYLTMLIVPLFTLVLTTLLLAVVFQGDMQHLRSVYDTKIEGFEDKDDYLMIKRAIEREPSLLDDRGYLDELSAELKAQDAALFIRSGDRVLYASEGVAEETGLTASLPPFERAGMRYVSPMRSYGYNEYYHFVRHDLLDAEGKPVALYVIAKVDPIVYFAKKYAPYLLVAAVIVLVLTNAALTYYMSRRIVRPIMSLRKAAMRFTEGKLDAPVRVSGKDEIGQLGTAFEELRARLNESMAVQERYESNRKELVASISHDLKTPITSIRGYVDGLREGIADSPEKTERYLRTIAAKAAEMDRLIDELFLFSKLELYRVAFAYENVNVQALLRDWADELAFDLDKEGVTLRAEFRVDPSAETRLDRDAFGRVLTNIVQNSLKYMDKQPKRMELAATTGKGEWTLAIGDNGAGIPADALPFVFERFYRADPSRNADTGGSGLGLAIAKRIVTEHGGTIRAESAIGEGTRIVISLPISPRGGNEDEHADDLDRGRR